MELVVSVLNEAGSFAGPVIVFLAFMIAVTSFITVMMLDPDAGFPSVELIPVLLVTGVGTLVSGCVFLKFVEELRANSVIYLKEIEAEISAFARLESMRRRRKCNCLAFGRSFRRRPIGIRLGIFIWMDDGISVTYFMTIVDKTMNFIFMVDLRSHPVWLW